MPLPLILLLAVGLPTLLLLLCSYPLHRSPMAALCALYLRIANPKRGEESAKRLLVRLGKRNGDRLPLPRAPRGVTVSEEDFFGMQVLTFGTRADAERGILYLHGGAYARPPRYHHLKFVGRLAKRSGLPVVMPLYPKAPHHTVLDVLPLLDRFYRTLTARYRETVLMGDSSGGGLALSLLAHSPAMRTTPPRRAILLAPWVDITLKNPEIPRYERRDPLLSAAATRPLGLSFAAGLDPRDGRISPLFAELAGLPPTDLFVGDRDLLFPDVCLLADRLRAAGVAVTLEAARGMNHVYPIYPIPEARRALTNIVNKTLQ